jgi:hypothetical protein
MGEHLIDGEFQSDKYPTTPRGKVPLSVKDRTAQDLLWLYAQRRRAVDAEFAADLEQALRNAGHDPKGYPPAGTRCDWKTWSSDTESWCADDEELAPGIYQFARAISVYVILQNRSEVTVAEVAQAFNCDPVRVAEAINQTGVHMMFLTFSDGESSDYSRQIIEHDGE